MNIRSFSLKTAAAGLALAVGIPAMAMAANPFEDVAEGQWYTEPVDWAYDNGITTGKTPTTFNGWDETNRYEVVTFVHCYHENLIAPALAALEDDTDEVLEVDATMFGFDSSETTQNHTGNSLADTGMGTTVTIPHGYTGVIVIDFTAESACWGGGAAANWCSVRFHVDGSAVTPSSFAFDSTDEGNAVDGSWAAHTTRWITDELTPGTYDVDVLMGASADGVEFRLDDMTLTAEVKLTGEHELGFAND